MSRRCFFIERIQADAEFVDLSAEASHHLEKVLRLGIGETVEVRDGAGNAWKTEIALKSKGCVSLRIVSRLDLSFFESPLKITLALALVRTDIIDMAVRQATEMGVSKIALFPAARSQYSLAGERAGKKALRWSKIAREALCQCCRTRVPEISIFEDLDSLLAAHSNGERLESGGAGEKSEILKIIALEGEREQSIDIVKRKHPSCREVLAIIGPEGGWETPEILKLIGAGFHPVRFGPRILRFETAAVAMISSIQLLWGDFGETGQKGSEKNEVHEMRFC